MTDALAWLDVTLGQVAADLALDEALLQHAEDAGVPGYLRFWTPTRTAVVLGATGKVARDVHLDACQRDGVEIARRASGGGTVVIGPGTLNVTIVLPIDADPAYAAVDLAQKAVLARCADGLRSLGPSLDVAGSGDLVIDGRKVAGSAQRRLRRRFLVHFTILVDAPLALIEKYLAEPERQPAHRAGRSHAQFLTCLEHPRDRLVAQIREAWRPAPAASDLIAAIQPQVDILLRDKYGRDDWVHRF